MGVGFQNLKKLIKNMQDEGWIIDVFNFEYKQERYNVVLKLYTDKDVKPDKYAKASLEFCRESDSHDSIMAYIDFFEVRFYSVHEFCRFFRVVPGDKMRDLFLDFSKRFAPFIPIRRNLNLTKKQKDLMVRRCDADNPDAIYCFDVRRSGTDSHGQPKHRTLANGNKAALLRPELFDRFSADPTLSFFFTDDATKEKLDKEILKGLADR